MTFTDFDQRSTGGSAEQAGRHHGGTSRSKTITHATSEFRQTTITLQEMHIEKTNSILAAR